MTGSEILSDHVTAFKEKDLCVIFEWFDQNSIKANDDSDVITTENFQKLLDSKQFHRRHFHYPTYAELMKELETLKAFRVLTKDQYLYLLEKWALKAEIKHELLLAFKVFDTEKRGFLDLEEVTTIVTTNGEIFDEDEVREYLRDADVRGDGKVLYKNFIEMLFNMAPKLYDLKTDYLYENPDEDPSVPPIPK